MSEVTVRGSVLDASGVASVSCNGIAAVVTESLFTLTVGVAAGTNVITVSAYDLAGHLGTRESRSSWVMGQPRARLRSVHPL